MMGKVAIKTLDTIIYAVSTAALIGIIIAVFLLSQDVLLPLIVCCCSAVVLICLFLSRQTARRQFVRFTDSVCKKLDNIIEENYDRLIDLDDDTLISKIGTKLLKIGEVTRGAAEQSEQLKKTVQELVSDISHQLKTPLSNIKMATETLEDEKLDREQRQYFISGLKKQVTKLEFLIEAMTKISRLENGTIAPTPEISSLNDLLESAIATVRPMANEKRIAIVSEITGLSSYFDMRWTSEALFNILDNAVKYTPNQGEISISAQQLALYTRIDVRDTGIGILPENINKIFKRFYRENRQRQASGVGVGLYLAREIISRQGGYITAKSAIGKGTIISMFLQNKAEKG